VVDRKGMNPLATVAEAESFACPPYVSGASMYAATVTGEVLKLNASTGAPETAFGTNGRASVGGGVKDIMAFGGWLYVLTPDGIFRVHPATGEKTLLYFTTGESIGLGGFTIDPVGRRIGFAGLNRFHVIPLDDPGSAMVFQAGTDPNTSFLGQTPTYDRATSRFIIGHGNGNLFAFP